MFNKTSSRIGLRYKIFKSILGFSLVGLGSVLASPNGGLIRLRGDVQTQQTPVLETLNKIDLGLDQPFILEADTGLVLGPRLQQRMFFKVAEVDEKSDQPKLDEDKKPVYEIISKVYHKAPLNIFKVKNGATFETEGTIGIPVKRKTEWNQGPQSSSTKKTKSQSDLPIQLELIDHQARTRYDQDLDQNYHNACIKASKSHPTKAPIELRVGETQNLALHINNLKDLVLLQLTPFSEHKVNFNELYCTIDCTDSAAILDSIRTVFHLSAGELPNWGVISFNLHRTHALNDHLKCASNLYNVAAKRPLDQHLFKPITNSEQIAKVLLRMLAQTNQYYTDRPDRTEAKWFIDLALTGLDDLSSVQDKLTQRMSETIHETTYLGPNSVQRKQDLERLQGLHRIVSFFNNSLSI